VTNGKQSFVEEAFGRMWLSGI